jgi:hypothetical protein
VKELTMNILRGTLAAMVIGLLLVPPSTAAEPSNDVIHIATAQWGSTGPDGCTSKQAEVQMYTVEHGRPELPSVERAVYFSLTTYDSCTGQTLASVSGQPDLAADAIAIDDGLQNARLDVQTVGIDSNSGSPVPVSIHLGWAATQQTDDAMTSSHYHSSLQVVNYVRTDASASATASGSVAAGTTEYASGFQYAYLASEEGPYIEVLKPPRSALLAAAGTATTTASGNFIYQSGADAIAQWVEQEPTGCTYSQTYVDALNRTPGSAWGVDSDTFSAISIWSATYNACTGTASRAVYAYKVLAPTDVRMSLGGSRLTLTLDGYDLLAGASVPVAVDLSWSGTGVPSGWQLIQRSHQGDLTYQRIVNQQWRTATLQGTLTFGGVPLVSRAPDWATVSTFDDRTVVQ